MSRFCNGGQSGGDQTTRHAAVRILQCTETDCSGAVVTTASGSGSVLAAALVLLCSDRRRARAAMTQGGLPLPAVLVLVARLLLA